MFTKTEVTENGDIVVNLVKTPVMTFEADYNLWNTEAHNTGMILRRNYAACRERCVFEGHVSHHQEFIVPTEKEPYQGAITRASVQNAERINLYGISDFHSSQKSLIAEMSEGQTSISSAIYDRYLLDCDSVPNGVGSIQLFSDLQVAHSNMGHILTQGYSSIHMDDVMRVGSVYALTFEPTGTRIRFAVSFDEHKTYHVFHKKQLVHIGDTPEEILEGGNDRNDLCYGFRNMVPNEEQKKADFKIVLQSDNPAATPVFYGFRCSLYRVIKGTR